MNAEREQFAIPISESRKFLIRFFSRQRERRYVANLVISVFCVTLCGESFRLPNELLNAGPPITVLDGINRCEHDDVTAYESA